MRVRSSPMKFGTASSSTATANSGKEPRLVDCPRCGVPVVKIRSKRQETCGEVFFKCPNNVKEDPRTCGFIRSEEEYETYLSDLEMKAVGEGQCVGDGNDAPRLQCKELKQELGLVKQQLDMALVEIWNLKIQRSEIKEEKQTVVMDISVAVVGCAVVIGLLVGSMWKKNGL